MQFIHALQATTQFCRTDGTKPTTCAPCHFRAIDRSSVRSVSVLPCIVPVGAIDSIRSPSSEFSVTNPYSHRPEGPFTVRTVNSICSRPPVNRSVNRSAPSLQSLPSLPSLSRSTEAHGGRARACVLGLGIAAPLTTVAHAEHVEKYGQRFTGCRKWIGAGRALGMAPSTSFFSYSHSALC